MLSEQAPPYDYFMLGSNYGKIKVNYIHGFLESNKERINRYITSRGLEWTNKKNLILSISEIVIYSGENRSIDFSYLNPISTHLELELNDRLNINGTFNANAIWQLSSDILFKNKIRLSGNFLIDELVLDKSELNGEKEHGLAYSYKLCVTTFKSESSLVLLKFSNIYIGTPALRHSQGYNNFVQRSKPLGWVYGSDGKEFKFGMTYLKSNNLILDVNFGDRLIGSESIRSRPYEAYKDYKRGKFPSGEVEKTRFYDLEIKCLVNRYIYASTILKYHDFNNSTSLYFGLNLNLSLSSSIII